MPDAQPDRDGELGHIPAGETNFQPRQHLLQGSLLTTTSTRFCSQWLFIRCSAHQAAVAALGVQRSREARKLTDGSHAGDAKLLEYLQSQNALHARPLVSLKHMNYSNRTDLRRG